MVGGEGILEFFFEFLFSVYGIVFLMVGVGGRKGCFRG